MEANKYKYENSPVALKEDGSRYNALRKLFDDPDKEEVTRNISNEIPVFQLYLTIALDNVERICERFEAKYNDIEKVNWGHDYEPSKIRRYLEREGNCEMVEKLANFLWIFKIDNPADDYKKYECRARAIDLVERLYMMRSFLCHLNNSGIDSLIAGHSFYTFFEGELADNARNEAVSNCTKTDKILKMRLMTPQVICYEGEGEKMGKRISSECTYAFTRKGIIMLICLALYKDEAAEFCQSLHDMKLCRKDVLEECAAMEEAERENIFRPLKKKASTRRAMHIFFSYYSMRRGYGAVREEDHDFICFTHILGYLNKVPSTAMAYLALKQERKMLDDLRRESTESESNKETKYMLHERLKPKTLSFLAKYCEDFKIFPSIAFKHLDTSDDIGRGRYFFKKTDESDKQDFHYIIKNDAIRFEWCPKEHYGDIHIDRLRSAVSLDELRRMIIASERGIKVNEALDKYFSAYHRILENALSEGDKNFIDRSRYLEDLSTVTGATIEELSDDGGDNKVFREKMSPYFPVNLTRFFIPQDNIPTDEELTNDLMHEIKNQISYDEELINELEQMRKWAHIERDKRPEMPEHRRMNDGDYIYHVFRTINLYLSDENKYRQLPRGERHRGEKDIEFQAKHAIVGRFPLDQVAFWDMLKGVKGIYEYVGKKKNRTGEKKDPREDKRRPELAALVPRLMEAFRIIWKEEIKYLTLRLKNDKEPLPLPPLSVLSEASLRCHLDFCKEKLNSLKGGGIKSREELERECKRYGIRVGLPLSKEALYSTILRIDWDKWCNAYNWKENMKWINRRLDGNGHIVTQIPLTNCFTVRLLQKQIPRIEKQFPTRRYKGIVEFLFNDAIARSKRWRLRDFYGEEQASSGQGATQNILMKARITGSLVGTLWDTSLDEELRSKEAVPGRRVLYSKAVELKKTYYEDLLLLSIAEKYQQKFNKSEAFSEAGQRFAPSIEEGGSIYTFFETSLKMDAGNGLSVLVKPNDCLRMVFTRVKNRSEELHDILLADGRTDEELKSGVDFNDVTGRMREVEAEDNRIRKDFLDLIFQLEGRVAGEAEVVNKYAKLIDDEPCKEEKKRIKKTMNDEIYRLYLNAVNGKKLNDKAKKLPRERFDELVKFRNFLLHGGFNISDEDVKKARETLRLFGIIEPSYKKRESSIGHVSYR